MTNTTIPTSKDLDTFEVCDYVQRSLRSVSRYVKEGKIKPKEIKSEKGTVEYRYPIEEVEALRIFLGVPKGKTRQDKKGRQDMNGTPKRPDTWHAISDDMPLMARQTPEDNIEAWPDMARQEGRHGTPLRDDKTAMTSHMARHEEPAIQGRIDTPPVKREDTPSDGMSSPGLLQTFVDFLKHQIGVKDEQIHELMESNKRKDFLVGDLQARLKGYESGPPLAKSQTPND